MAKIILGVIIENISTRSDGSFKIVVGTQEIDKTQVSDLFDMRNQFVKGLFSSSNISPLEETLIDEQKLKDGKRVKTRSQRLRAVLYRKWEQSQSSLDFDGYYNEYMDEIINKEKATLE